MYRVPLTRYGNIVWYWLEEPERVALHVDNLDTEGNFVAFTPQVRPTLAASLEKGACRLVVFLIESRFMISNALCTPGGKLTQKLSLGLAGLRRSPRKSNKFIWGTAMVSEKAGYL